MLRIDIYEDGDWQRKYGLRYSTLAMAQKYAKYLATEGLQVRIIHTDANGYESVVDPTCPTLSLYC